MDDLALEPAPERPRPRTRLLFVLAALFGVAMLSACDPVSPTDPPPPTPNNPSCTKLWVGPANGVWTAATSWSPQGVPTATDVACANAGTSIRVSGTSAVGNALLDGALRIESTGRLELVHNSTAGISNLTLEGTFSGNGNLVLAGASTLRGTFEGSGNRWVLFGASATITGDLRIAGGSVDNYGLTSWTAGDITLCDGAALTNESIMTVSDTSAVVNPCQGGDQARVSNGLSASLTTPASGSFTVNVAFDNDGTFNAPGALVTLSQGTSPGESDQGKYLPTGENIVFSGGTRQFEYTAQIGGPGGTTRLAGASFTGDTRINFPLRWTSGQLAGPGGSTTVGNGVPITANGSPVSVGAGSYVDNQGALTLTTTLSLCGDALFENSGPMTMSGASAKVVPCNAGDQPTLFNYYQIAVNSTAGARALISTPFNNYGDVFTNSTGRLDIAAGTSDGEADYGYYYPNGAEAIAFTGGVREFDSAAEVGLLGGSIAFNGATITGDVTATGPIRWMSGEINGYVLLDTDWGGTLTADSGPVTLGTNGYIETVGYEDLAKPALFVLGTTMRMCGNATVYIDTTTLRLANASAQIERCSPTDKPAIYNSGDVVARPTSGGTIVIGVPFDNFGTVQVVSGSKLELQEGNTPTGTDFGAYTGVGTATFSGGTRRFYPEYSSITGSNRLTGGAFVGGPTIIGTFEWTGGQLAGPDATTTIAAGSTVTVNGTASLGAGSTLINQGTINLSGTIDACAGGITVQNNKTVNLSGTGTISGCGTTNSTFANAAGATLAATPTGGNAEIGIPVTNEGTVTVNAGAVANSLRVGRYTQTAGTTTLQTASSRLQPLSGPATVSGGTLGGIGQLTGNLALSSTLQTGVGTTIGTFTITGNLTTSTGAVLDVAVNPTGPVIGRVQVNGTAALTGTQRVRFLANPTGLPKIYQVLAANGGRTGTFSSLLTTGLSGSPLTVMTYLPTSASITVG
jgi:hypothetical protein